MNTWKWRNNYEEKKIKLLTEEVEYKVNNTKLWVEEDGYKEMKIRRGNIKE